MKPTRVFYNTLPIHLRKLITQHCIKNSLDSCRICIELNQKLNRLLENPRMGREPEGAGRSTSERRDGPCQGAGRSTSERRDGSYYFLTGQLKKIRKLENYIQDRYRGTTDYVIFNLPQGPGSRYSPYSDQTRGARQTSITSCQSIDIQLDQIEETICRERVKLSLIFSQLEETDRRASEILYQ